MLHNDMYHKELYYQMATPCEHSLDSNGSHLDRQALIPGSIIISKPVNMRMNSLPVLDDTILRGTDDELLLLVWDHSNVRDKVHMEGGMTMC